MSTTGISGADSNTRGASLLEQMKIRQEQQSAQGAARQTREVQDSKTGALGSEKAADTHGASAQKTSDTDIAHALRDNDLLTAAGARYAGHAPESVARNSGTYALQNTDDGPKIVYSPLRKDEPESAAEPVNNAPEGTPNAQNNSAAKAAAKPEQPKDKDNPGDKKPEKEQKTVCDTDAVDREIKMIKQKVQQLKSAERAAQTEEEAAQAKQELAQAERELAQKNNDTYRRSHAQFTTQP